MENAEQITIKIKTMDEAIFEFKVQVTDKIKDLKMQIKDDLGIPLRRQRIVFMGKLINDDNTIESYEIKENNVLHLIASLENREMGETQEIDQISRNESANNEGEPNARPGFTNFQEEPVLNERAEQEILAGIFRTLSDTSLNRRNVRRRLMQQRSSGFEVNGQMSLEVIRQNLITIKNLENDMIKNYNRLLNTSMDTNNPPGYDFSNRKLVIGQWIDVLDTIDQWLEAEVTNVNETQVYVHYNGWGRRWDEWIDMSSPRIAAFRTHTVQSPYSKFMSPNPCQSLDGDHTHVQQQIDSLEKTLLNTQSTSNNLGKEISQLIQCCQQREEILKKSKIDKSNFSRRLMKAKTMKTKKTRKRISTLRSHEKYNLDRDVDTQSNFSLKVREADLRRVSSSRDDCRSMKSLKMREELKEEEEEGSVEKKEKCDSISSKSQSFKQVSNQLNKSVFNHERSQMSQNRNFNFPDYISEERSIDYESDDDNEEEEEKDKSEISDDVKMANIELKARCIQIAPYMERMGRLLVDLAPHVAMLGQRVGNETNILSNISMMTQEYSNISQNNRFGSTLNQFLTPNAGQVAHNGQAIPNQNTSNNGNIGRGSHFGMSIDNQRNLRGMGNLNRQAPSNENIARNMDNYTLQSRNSTLKFQIPIMLNPGELLSITPRQNNLFGDGNVHLHLNAQVHLPPNDTDYTTPPAQPLRTANIPRNIPSPSQSQVQTQPMSAQNLPSQQQTPSQTIGTSQTFRNSQMSTVANPLSIPRRQNPRNTGQDTNSIFTVNSPVIRHQAGSQNRNQEVPGFNRHHRGGDSSRRAEHEIPSFGGLRHPFSEGPAEFDRDRRVISSRKFKEKRTGGGLSMMREGDRSGELLDEDSFNGTIEERDENEEPEMQDISFRDLDFGGSIQKAKTERGIHEIEENDFEDIQEQEETLTTIAQSSARKRHSSQVNMNLLTNENILEGIESVDDEIIEEGEITENQVPIVQKVLQKEDMAVKHRQENKESLSVAGFMSAEKVQDTIKKPLSTKSETSNWSNDSKKAI